MFILFQTTLEGDRTVTLLSFRQQSRETHDPRPLVHRGRIHFGETGHLRLVLLPNLSRSPDPEPPRV
ncbi:hypothetical protein PM8797T_31358 [Gimesia maris DSM 8797]|uniref:Uncharacterized protein n=1 Tax=Gimesia maris TaxID=122 RepID=A0ABX5YM39_9PLAN|nr:hypothetical protein PM8797T_31358 [Gimesia maris DSM 8797]QEG16727.1 hypothetical protein GmarT_25940 [Gimesia maris]